MSATNTNTRAVFIGLESGLSGLWTGVRNYFLYRKTLAGMRRLSDRELADFGLDRCEINRIAHACVYGCDAK